MKTLLLVILMIALAVVLASVNAAFAYDIHPLPTQALYMKSNSVGHMYMKFNTYYNNQTIKLGPIPIYDVNLTNHIPLNLTDLSIVPNQTSITLAFNSTVIDYTVTARNNLTGIFALQLEQWDDMAPYVVGSDPQKIYQERQDYAKCTLIPFVVGLDMSQIDKGVLSRFVTFKSGCSVSLVQKHLVGIESIDSLKTSYLPSGVKQDIPVPIPGTISPLQQFKSGVTTQNITCKEGFVLAIKKQGHQPACISPDTVSKLVLRGWSENPLNGLLLKYGNQTQANLAFYDIMNEPKIRDWSMKGWRYSDYSYASNGETHQSSATIHLYLSSNIGKHECENGSYGIVVINLKPIEIEHNYTEAGCEIATTTSVDPGSNVK